jgi:hypothetical protein
MKTVTSLYCCGSAYTSSLRPHTLVAEDWNKPLLLRLYLFSINPVLRLYLFSINPVSRLYLFACCVWQGLTYALFVFPPEFFWSLPLQGIMYTLCVGIVYVLFVVFFLVKALWVCMLYFSSITSMACRFCVCKALCMLYQGWSRLFQAPPSYTTHTPHTRDCKPYLKFESWDIILGLG